MFKRFGARAAKTAEELAEEGSKKRALPAVWAKAVWITGIAMSLFHIYFVGFSPITPWILYTAHLCFALILTLTLYTARKAEKGGKVPLHDIALIIAVVASWIYLLAEMDTIIYRIGIMPTTPDMIVSVVIVLLVLEITRRTNGNILPVIAILFIVYAKFGNFIPGIFGHRGYSWNRIMSYLIGFDAIFSVPLGVSATFVFMFLVFTAFLHFSGVGAFFIDFALGLTGSTRGGPAKAAVVASALFGTVSGNSAANVVGTGSFTIPLMKSIGYSPTFAGAVEAVASTGGQIMPPILGSAAFILAQLIGAPYSTVMVASIIPAVLYFVTVFLMVDLEAVRTGLKGLSKEKTPDLKKVIMTQGYLFLPIFVIVFVLLVLKASPVKAALYATAAAILVSLFRKETRMGPKKILDALSEAATSSLGMVAACATAGIVIGVLNLTGAGLKFANAIISFSGGNLPFALVLTMVATTILGMGLPTTASYLITAAVVAPALIEMGVSNLAAHMFVFYYACLSAITPPVALAAYAAAGIAKASPMKIAIIACKLGITAFIIPFMFIYGPSLLFQGSISEILGSSATALFGVTVLSFGMQGQMFSVRLAAIERILMVAAALLLIDPGLTTDLIGMSLVAAAFVSTRVRKRVKAA